MHWNFVVLSYSLTSMILWLENPVVFAPQKESFSSTSRKEPLFPFEVKLFKLVSDLSNGLYIWWCY